MDTYMCRNIFAILSPIEVIVFFVLVFRLVLRTRNLCSSEYIIDHFKLHYIKQLKGVKFQVAYIGFTFCLYTWWIQFDWRWTENEM